MANSGIATNAVQQLTCGIERALQICNASQNDLAAAKAAAGCKMRSHLMGNIEAEHEGQDEHAAGTVPHDGDQISEDLQLEVIKAVLAHHILQHRFRPCIQVLLHIFNPASHRRFVNNGSALT